MVGVVGGRTDAPSRPGNDLFTSTDPPGPSSWAPAPTWRSRARTLGHIPALDGLRAVAVLAVVAFHAGLPRSSGGFLGVSTFFTLSGFLITVLLVIDAGRARGTGRAGTGSLLGQFWARRVRRLVPMSLLGIAAGIGATAGRGTDDQKAALTGDVASALADVANWRFMLAGRSYSALFTEPSALQHYWSLAIEEQSYVVLPVLVCGCLWAAGRRRNRSVAYLTVVLAVLLIGSVASALAAAGDVDRVYYGTDTRAAELLVGCLLALAVGRTIGFGDLGSDRLTRPGGSLRPITATVLSLVGLTALAGSATLWATVAQHDDALYPVGLLAYAGLSALVVLGAIVPGPLAWLLRRRPLVALGRISFGVYVLHWPVFVVLDERLGWPGATLLAARLTATLVLAVVAFHVIEQPIRHRRPVAWLPRRPAVLVVPAVALLVGAAVATTTTTAGDELDVAAAERLLATPAEPIAATAPATGEPPAPFVVFVGDNTAAGTAYSLVKHFAEDQRAMYGGTSADPACSLLRGTRWREAGRVRSNGPVCGAWEQTWTGARDAAHADVVLVQLGDADLLEHELPAGAGTRWAALGDAELDARLGRELDATVERLTGEKTLVAFATVPTDRAALDAGPQRLDAATHRARATRFNQLLREAAARHPHRAAVVDADSWLAANGGAAALRPGGTNLDRDVAARLGIGLLEEAVAAHRSAWRNRSVAPSTGSGAGLRVLVVGDSTALPIGVALHGRARSNGDVAVASVARSGCGLARGGKRWDKGRAADVDCPDWDPVLRDAIDSFRPTLVVVVDTWEITDRTLPGDDRWRSVGDPVYDRYLRRELDAAIGAMRRGGAAVALVQYPAVRYDAAAGDGRQAPPQNDPVRMHRFNALLAELADAHDGVGVVDLAGHAETFAGGVLDRTERPDGVHFTEVTARRLVDDWLLAELQRVERDERR